MRGEGKAVVEKGLGGERFKTAVWEDDQDGEMRETEGGGKCGDGELSFCLLSVN